MGQQVKPPSALNRVVVRTSVVHCLESGESRTWGKPRSYRIRSLDEPHVAWLALGGDWRRIDFGPFDEPSLLLIENHLKDSCGVVELSSDGGEPFARLHQGRDASIPCPGTILARCVGGTSKVRLIVVPS